MGGACGHGGRGATLFGPQRAREQRVDHVGQRRGIGEQGADRLHHRHFDASGARRVTLLSSGSEVEIALAARDTLEADGVATAVVSRLRVNSISLMD